MLVNIHKKKKKNENKQKKDAGKLLNLESFKTTMLSYRGGFFSMNLLIWLD